MQGSMTALDVVQVIIQAVAAVAQMVARGFTKDQALEHIRRLDADVAKVDAGVDHILDGGGE